MVGFKLEGQVIMRHPGYGMDDRLMLRRIDYENWTVRLDTGVYPLNAARLPTVDPPTRTGSAPRRPRWWTSTWTPSARASR